MKQPSRAFLVFLLLTIVYVVLCVVLPPNAATQLAYHLTDTSYRVFVSMINLPLIAVWFAAFYGYTKLGEYAKVLGKGKDGRSFAKIAKALMWFVWGLPLSSLLSTVLAAITHYHIGFFGAALVINHYFSIIVSVVAFTIMSAGTRGLAEIVKTRPSLNAIRLAVALFTIVGVAYTYLTIHGVVGQPRSQNPFHMRLWLILLTVVIPYLYAWFIGLISAYEIYLYSKHSQGLLYKRAFAFVSSGIVITVATSIAGQYLVSDSPYLRKITLNGIFLLAYALLFVYAGGFALLALGAKKLKRIEEV